MNNIYKNLSLSLLMGAFGFENVQNINKEWPMNEIFWAVKSSGENRRFNQKNNNVLFP